MAQAIFGVKINQGIVSAACVMAFCAVAAPASASPSDCAGKGDYGATLTCIEGGPQAWEAVSPVSTATGAYQMTFDALIDTGYIAKSEKGNYPPAGPGDWSGVQWTGKGGINSRADYIGSPAAQNESLDAFNQINWRQVQSVSPVGTTVNGVPMTQAGVYATSHMLGMGGYAQWASCDYQAHCLSDSQAAANNMSKEQLQQHLMERMAVMGDVDPSAITGGGGGDFGGQGGGVASNDLPDTLLMPWTAEQYQPTVLPGQM
jgi:hypothetical protein